MNTSASQQEKPVVVIIGSSGNIGSALRKKLEHDYSVIGFDRDTSNPCDFSVDLRSIDSVCDAFDKFSRAHGDKIAAVIHLAAYFDFSGEESPLYEEVNVKGTKNVLEALQNFEVGRFVYSSTMLVHKPGSPGELIDEYSPIEPKWAYPVSKARAEDTIRRNHGKIPYAILRLAGLYDEDTAIPTLSHQIARIYERDIKSMLYAGEVEAGQAFIHRDDMLALFAKVVEHRQDLPPEVSLLAGESEVLSYRELQDELGRLLHGEDHWLTLTIPNPVAKMGAFLEESAEPKVPDAIDDGKEPFIKPFMIEMASDHYELDTSKAKSLLSWLPKKSIRGELPNIVRKLQNDPVAWYKNNGLHLPHWLRAAEGKSESFEKLRWRHLENFRREHFNNLWAPFINIVLGLWLITAPATLGYHSQAMVWSDVISGVLVLIFSCVSLSPRGIAPFSRWLLGAVGLWLMSAPLVFWAPTAASYLNGTLVGALVVGFALLVRPFPGGTAIAANSGPSVPPGWVFSPSDWFQRIPIIALAVVGFLISRYLTAYQLGHIDSVWEPFFDGARTPEKNGTEEIITSKVSEAWPVPDAGLGALTYMLEILTGIMGSRSRWRTMPWLVLLFGFMIVPLGAVSITFIVIQPIVLDTWCTLCLIAAAAMLLQIPYSFDEIVATLEFLRRRAKAGQPWIRILFTGDTDEGREHDPGADDFSQPLPQALRSIFGGGVSAPPQLLGCAVIGVWLLLTRLTIGSEGAMANAEHLIGALILTFTVTAFAEVMRSIRLINIFLGLALLISPFVLGAPIIVMLNSLVCGVLLIALSVVRGRIEYPYGEWSRAIV